ncbi:MAG: hypothetical protein EOP04_06675 [Proteobacteria bacterium]|nr:MAG: hypothetical protein EOP04_06675 [Pseudomonadota bacterium]
MAQQTNTSNTADKKSSAMNTGTESKLDMSALQEKILQQVTDLGDMLERAGEKIEGKGFEKIGEAIYSLGNKIEHLRDGFSPSKKTEDAQFTGASVTSDSGLKSSTTTQPKKDASGAV